jgi:LEA14-like dessication related protein
LALNLYKSIATKHVIIAILGSAVTLHACAGLRPGYETPTVMVNSFRVLPSAGAVPNFEIGLHVINPNRESLELRGIAYTVSLDDHELLKGVGNDLPVIEAYGEGDFTISASANLLAGIRFIGDLMKGSNDRLRYDLDAKLDVGGLRPAIRVRDSGEISLRPPE